MTWWAALLALAKLSFEVFQFVKEERRAARNTEKAIRNVHAIVQNAIVDARRKHGGKLPDADKYRRD